MTGGGAYANLTGMGINPVKVLKEISGPDYLQRRVFTAKLRIAIFVGFWLLYLLLLGDKVGQAKPVTIAVLVTFVLTIVCYYNYFKNIFRIPSIILQILADLTAMTALVYLTGGPRSEYYLVYIFYVIAAGLFYNYRLAFFIAVLSVLFYIFFLFLCSIGIIDPLEISFSGLKIDNYDFPGMKPVFLLIFVSLAVYATKIAHYFTQKRERMLEERNKELTALQRMSATIRTISSLGSVFTKVVNGVLEGLEFKLCLLLFIDRSENRIRCIVPENNSAVETAENELGFKFEKLLLPLSLLKENEAFKQLEEGKIIFRRDISELNLGLESSDVRHRLIKVQEKLDIKRVVAIPLISSREIIGALIGFSSEPFVEDQKVSTFQAFADQSSLTLEAAILISELKKKNIALIEAIRVKSEFLATMSHELRTPLTAIIGFSELLIEKVMGGLNNEQEESLREILTNANNLLEMINNLLDLAKSDSGKMELSKRRFNWKEMLKGIERTLAPLIKRRDQRLTVDVSPDVAELVADEKRMHQIVLNLLGNAIKFTPEKGEIKIKSGKISKIDKYSKYIDTDLKSQRVRNLYKNGGLICTVEDNGIGIPPEHILNIFDVFRQVDSSETKSYEGSGLGLALVKQFVEMHGGVVWVESEMGKGTKFTFIIPLEE